jgi:predicted phosphoribosyltransferase
MFKDRHHAGIRLAEKLEDFNRCGNCIIFAIPRGGVVIGAVVAERLNLPLDLVITKKIRAPYNPELAIGSVDPTGNINVNQNIIAGLNISSDYLQTAAETTTAQIKEQLEQYRKSSHYPSLEQTIAIIVDDGIATGQTAIAAIGFLRSLDAQRIIVATPVIAPSTLSELNKLADEVRYVLCEERFFAVGQFYRDFAQVNDEQVMEIMADIQRKNEN